MADYRSMYLKLFSAISDAQEQMAPLKSRLNNIEQCLMAAQKVTEEIFVQTDDTHEPDIEEPL